MTTRRQVLAAAIAAPIVTVPAGAATLVCMPISTSPEWNAALAMLIAAEVAHENYHTAIFEPAWEQAKVMHKQRIGEEWAAGRKTIDILVKDFVPPKIAAEEKRLDGISASAFCAVADFKASTPADIIAKIEFHKSRDCELLHDHMLADLRRVFGEG